MSVIAKVHGACFTGALEMALHCDFIFTTHDTKFGDTHAKLAKTNMGNVTDSITSCRNSSAKRCLVQELF